VVEGGKISVGKLVAEEGHRLKVHLKEGSRSRDNKGRWGRGMGVRDRSSKTLNQKNPTSTTGEGKEPIQKKRISTTGRSKAPFRLLTSGRHRIGNWMKGGNKKKSNGMD